MSFEQEARANADSRGFLNRLSRRQLLSEVAKSTRDQLGVSIKKIRAELHVNEITNWLDNVEGMKVGGAESVFEPDGNEVKIFNMFDQPYPGEVYYNAVAGVRQQYHRIPDPYMVEGIKYYNRETMLCNPSKTAIFFDGASAHLDLGADTSVWSKTINKFTVRIRMRPTELPAVPAFRNLLSCTDGVDAEIAMWFDAGGSFLAGIQTTDGIDNISTDDITDTTKWVEVVMTYDKDAGANNLKVYFDGVLFDSVTHTGALQIDAATKMWIGRYEFDPIGTSHYKGYAADFMFWSDAVLNQTDITNLSNGDIHKVMVPDYWLPMNDGITNPVDLVSGTKTASMLNEAVYATIDQDDDTFVWVKNGITGSYPVMLRTGYSLGLNLTTVNTAGITKRRNGQFLTFSQVDPSTYTTFNGIDTQITEADKASLDLVQFAVYIRFRTSKEQTDTSFDYMVSKGNFSTETAGQNLNYFIDIGDTNRVQGGFETSAGVNRFVESNRKVNDGKWHTAIITYDQVTLKLYVDGVLEDSLATTDTPDTNALALIIGAHTGSVNFFVGDIAEVIIWNNDLTTQEVIELSWNQTIPQLSAMVYSNFMSTTSFDGIDDVVNEGDINDLTQFSVAVKFKAARLINPAPSEQCIISKGGIGSDSPGNNDNYTIRIQSGGNINGGFEEASGTDHYVSDNEIDYYDGQEHIAIITYDQVNVKLYVDGVLKDTHATATSPENNAQPFCIGRNSRAADRFFFGDIFYVYVWNNDLTSSEVAGFVNNGTIPQTGALVYTKLFEVNKPPTTQYNKADLNWVSQNFTESIWFYASDLVNTGKKRVVKIQTLDGNNYYSYMIDNADNKLFIEFVLAGTPIRLESTAAVTANAWHHLVVTWEFGTPTIKGRLDDVAMTSSSKVGHAALTSAYTSYAPYYGGFPKMMYHEQFMGMIDAHIYYKHSDTLLFDGTNDNIDCGNHTDLWSQSKTAFAFTFWIYPTINDSGSRRVVHHGAVTAHGFNCYLSTPTDITFEVRNSVNAVFESRFTGLTLNQFNHIACVYDNSLGSANVKIYVNGVLAGTTANLTEAINKSASLFLSDSSSDFQGNWKGFKWFNKALSGAEVLDDMKGGVSAGNPDYFLPMDEGVDSPKDRIKGKTVTLSGPIWSGDVTKVLTTDEMTNLKNYNTKYLINASKDPCISGACMSS